MNIRSVPGRSAPSAQSRFAVPGVRLTLWLAGLIIMGAGVLAWMSLRAGRERAPELDHDEVTAFEERLLHEGAELVTGLTDPFTQVKASHTHAEHGEPGEAEP